MWYFFLLVGLFSGLGRRAGVVAAEENVLIRGVKDRDLQGVVGCSAARCGRSWEDANSKCGTPCRAAVDGDESYRDIWCNQGCGESCFKDLDTTLGCCATATKVPSLFNKCSPIRCGVTANEAGGTCGMPCDAVDPERPDEYVNVCPDGQDCFKDLEITAACCKPDCTPPVPAPILPPVSPPPPPVSPSPPLPPAPQPSTDSCFSALATAEVEGKGPIAMNKLQIGDAVLSSDGSYSKVYSFSHYNTLVAAEYLQIVTASMDKHSPLEISKEHLIYRQDDITKVKMLVRAGDLKVGDYLLSQQEPSAIISIDTVERQGAYSPLTESGDIAVNSIAASVYVSREWIPKDVSGYALFYLEHAGTFPLRVFCKWIGGCEQETYDEERGNNSWVFFWFQVEQLLMARLVVSFFLQVLSNPSTSLAAAMLGYYLYTWKKTKKAVAADETKA